MRILEDEAASTCLRVVSRTLLDSRILSCVYSTFVFRYLGLDAHWLVPIQKPKPKAAKGQFERMARMPRNQLLDMLFSLFREREHWSIKPLRERTQQPEVYLKEVLNEIAFLHRSGEHNGTWELMANFKGNDVRVLSLVRWLVLIQFATVADQRRECASSATWRSQRRQNGGLRRRRRR